MKSVLPSGHVSMAPIQFQPNEQCLSPGNILNCYTLIQLYLSIIAAHYRRKYEFILLYTLIHCCIHTHCKETYKSLQTMNYFSVYKKKL